MADKRKISTGGISGKNPFYKDPNAAGTAFQKEQRSRASSKFFRNFNRTKQRSIMTSYDDDNFLSIFLLYLNNINDGGNIEAAFDKGIDVGWEIGAQTGNIKDLVTDQETALKDWCRYWLQMAWNIAAQMARRPLTPVVSESSISANTNAAIYNWVQADWDAFISSLELLDCPDFIYRFMEKFLFVIKYREAYEISGVQVPPAYFIPIVDYLENTLAEMQAIRELAKGVSAQAMTHCRKFGIPFSKFSSDKLKSKEITRKGMFENQDLIAFFNMVPYTYRTSAANVRVDHAAILSGANLTTDYTNIKYIFDDSKDMSILTALYPIIGPTYHATNNPLANILSVVPVPANEYKVSILHMKNLGTAWTAGEIDTCHHILRWYLAYYYESALYGPVFEGANVTLSTKFITFTAHPLFDENINAHYDTGHVKGEEAINSCIQAFKYLIYGTL